MHAQGRWDSPFPPSCRSLDQTSGPRPLGKYRPEHHTSARNLDLPGFQARQIRSTQVNRGTLYHEDAESLRSGRTQSIPRDNSQDSHRTLHG